MFQLDPIVHGDLYSFGLEFSYEWAIPYWTFFNLTLAFQGVAILTAVASAVLTAAQWRRLRPMSSGVNRALHVFCAAALALSAFFFLRLDALVHGDLYNYGLQMSNQWAMTYWLYSTTLLSFEGIALTAATASLALNLLGFRRTRLDTTRIIAGVMLVSGLVILGVSVFYELSILAFIGLGLTFWGAILNYIQGEEYVKKPLLDRVSTQTITTLNHLLQELNYQGTAVYLPPRFFRNPGTTKAYISRDVHGVLPDPERIEQQGDQLFTTDDDGILFTPPGAEIAHLFEESLGTSFTQVDLQYLTQKLPRIMEETLEMARSVEITPQNHRILVKIDHPTLPDQTIVTPKPSGSPVNLGSHLTGAVACALAKTTGQPVIIQRQHTTSGGNSIEIEYRLLEEEPGA